MQCKAAQNRANLVNQCKTVQSSVPGGRQAPESADKARQGRHVAVFGFQRFGIWYFRMVFSALCFAMVFPVFEILYFAILYKIQNISYISQAPESAAELVYFVFWLVGWYSVGWLVFGIFFFVLVFRT